MLSNNIEGTNYFNKSNVQKKNNGTIKNPNMFVMFISVEGLLTQIKMKKYNLEIFYKKDLKKIGK